MKADHEDFFISYEEWRDQMINQCGIPLTRQYCLERVEALRNPDDPATGQFVSSFGTAYRDKVISWFERASKDKKAG